VGPNKAPKECVGRDDRSIVKTNAPFQTQGTNSSITGNPEARANGAGKTKVQQHKTKDQKKKREESIPKLFADGKRGKKKTKRVDVKSQGKKGVQTEEKDKPQNLRYGKTLLEPKGAGTETPGSLT